MIYLFLNKKDTGDIKFNNKTKKNKLSLMFQNKFKKTNCIMILKRILKFILYEEAQKINNHFHKSSWNEDFTLGLHLVDIPKLMKPQRLF